MKDRILEIIKTFEHPEGEWGSKTRFGKKIGADSGLVGDWINGKAKPGPRYKDRILQAYPVNPEWLNTGRGEMQRKGKSPAPQVEEVRQEHRPHGEITLQIRLTEAEIFEMLKANERMSGELKKSNEILKHNFGRIEHILERIAEGSDQPRDSPKIPRLPKPARVEGRAP